VILQEDEGRVQLGGRQRLRLGDLAQRRRASRRPARAEGRDGRLPIRWRRRDDGRRVERVNVLLGGERLGEACRELRARRDRLDVSLLVLLKPLVGAGLPDDDALAHAPRGADEFDVGQARR
jgi:hypothetical protein